MVVFVEITPCMFSGGPAWASLRWGGNLKMLAKQSEVTMMLDFIISALVIHSCFIHT
jgi:hypothetical protein